MRQQPSHCCFLVRSSVENNPSIVGNDIVYRVVKRDRSYYVEGLPDDWGDDDTYLLYRWPDGDVDAPYDADKMESSLYDLWQTSDQLEQAVEPYDRAVFLTPHGRFMTDGVHVVKDRRSIRDNPRIRSTRPPGVSQATKTFEDFNEYPSKGVSKFAREIVVPERMPYPGPCRWVTYRSDKWKNGTHDYIHTIASYPRVKCVMAGEDYPTVKVPLAVRNATTLTQIGLRALGFAFEYDGDECEAKVPAGTEWFWSQTARALYLIANKRKLVALVWGGDLNVEPRGIVG